MSATANGNGRGLSGSAEAVLARMWARERADEAARREEAIRGALENYRPRGLRGLVVVLGSPATALVVGTWAHVRIPFPVEVQRLDLTASASGSVELDLLATPAGVAGENPTPAGPAAAVSICGTPRPALTAAAEALALPLEDWTRRFLAGGEFLVVVVTAATLTGVVCVNLELRAT